MNLTQKPKSKPTQPKYPKLTHKFITKLKGEKKHGRFQETKTIFEEGKKYTYLQNMLLQRRTRPENELGIKVTVEAVIEWSRRWVVLDQKRNPKPKSSPSKA